MKFKANFVEKPGNFQMDDCQIEKVVELSHDDFCRLKIIPLADHPFIHLISCEVQLRSNFFNIQPI